ncbi:hypothetical protein GCK72_024423 [Caenorhabditis remanei]|uniref:Uncharacterized protein n=1 Tax=Caenorhabditis remanei TaxID=31234 RepID=A0A6A5FZA8_CAERE|nr:hypothetical protein GCK72_024423 [Caenorhabditis remanei]KAF1747957.1 hypothetical protein GCK72_024423 [Caenorhabditis remanei]
MASEEDEQWNVSVKVLVGNGKYREYRLPSSLCTDRPTLWGSKHEVGQRIADIVRDKKLKIGELKRYIQKIEQSQSIWLSLAKNVNGKSENFFLDALSASDEDLEKFEQLNFFSKKSWSKLRDVEELSEVEKDELSLIDNEVEPYKTDDVNENGENKLRHYEWMCKKSVGLSSSRQQSTEREDRNVTSSAVKETMSNGFTKTKKGDVVPVEIWPNSSQPVDSLNAVVVNGIEIDTKDKKNNLKEDQNTDDDVVPSVSNTNKVNVFDETVRNSNKQLEEIPTKLETSKLKAPEKEVDDQLCSIQNASSPAIRDIHSERIATDSTLEKSSQPPKVRMKDNEKDTTIKKEETVQESKKKSENGETKNASVSQNFSSQVKKPLADVSGISRLRLTSGSSVDVKPVPVTVPKVSGNIWERKAAEREQKQLEEKYEQQYPKPGSQTNGNTLSISDAMIKSKIETVQNGVISKRAAKKSKKEQLKTEPPKPSDSNGWITFSAKKGGRPTNGTFLRDLEKQESTSFLTRSSEDSTTSSSMQSLDLIAQSSNVSPENVTDTGEKKVEDGPKDEIQAKEPSNDAIKAEKRAKRRQRVHEKVKLSAKQNKEEEKKLKEQKRIEHELQILSEKKEKEVKQRLEYEQKKAEIQRIKRERESQLLTRKQKGCDPSKVQDMLESKERLVAHVKEKPLRYLMIGSKIYMDKRLMELATDRSMEINKNKHKILHTYKGRLKTMDRMNTFLIFMSDLTENTKDFRLEELLDYFTSKSLDVNEEPLNAVHEAIRTTFIQFCKNFTLKNPETMEKACQFADSLLQKMGKVRKTSEMIEKSNEILTNYKMLYTEAVDIMGLTSYLRTRMNTELFIMEEDYLLTVTESEICGYQGDETDDEEEFEKPEVHDMCCQTDGETYDVRAASMLPLAD